MSRNVILAGENPEKHTREEVGGKGLNLLRLYNLSQQTGEFIVPNFFIIPVSAEIHFSNTSEGTQAIYEGEEVREAFEKLKKPVGVRSSSPLEDGINASFAGMFNSFYGNNLYEELTFAANRVYISVFQDRVQRYADRMGVEFSEVMAIIVQEQITDAIEWGRIQLEDKKAITEVTDRKGRFSSSETEYSFLDEIFPEGFKWKMKPESEPRNWIGEGEFHYATYCAREAKKRLGLDGIVQVEFFLSPAKLPRFVQIRQLPATKSYAAELDLEIPKDVPYIESEICNDIAGELSLPVYLTTSQAGLKSILIETGQSFFIDLKSELDERAETFMKESRLARNRDFRQFRDSVPNERTFGLEKILPLYNKAWKEGNILFDDYILVCDKLDERVTEMANVTTNKRAIITCLEAERTSHAMTVARDLGIMCMGLDGNIMDVNYFYNQVETGDVVHMKSDGRKAVAYIEKRRDRDPYQR